MNGDVEYATRSRGPASFPESWGLPEGRLFSEERAAWVRRKVAEFAAAPRQRDHRTDPRLAVLRLLASKESS
jgi:hypothetical protein